MGIIARLVLSIAILIGWSMFSAGVSIPSTLFLGQISGRQFENSDTAYLTTSAISAAFTSFNMVTAFLLALILLTVWLGPIRRALAAIKKEWAAALVLAIIIPSLLGFGGRAEAYYDKQDWAETYFILPNESAFFIPDVGANQTSQTAFGSEAYFEANKIPAKRYSIQHTKLVNSGGWSDFYVPVGRLIIVDRTPFSREWVAQAHRGTSAKDESFPCQSKEGLDISVGIAIGASVLEASASKFLYRFGTQPQQGNRSDPVVIFTSVFYGRSLAQVMDGPVRSKIQALVCTEFTKRSFDDANSQAAAIMTAIETSTKAYLDSVGITLDFIGWADTFTFDKPVQDVINRRYVASKEAEIASSMQPHTATLQALAQAEATRKVADKWNGAMPSSVSLWWLPSGLTDLFTGMLGAKKDK